ncbi:MAG: hypothetical protein AB7I59_19605 [Geminicoccaceae bacterium]
MALAVPAAAATGGADARLALQGLEAMAAAATSADAAAAHRAFVQDLGQMQASVGRCNDFLGRHGANRRVAAVIKSITVEPGHLLFTGPEVIAQLERAVGHPIRIGQIDVERCVQLADGRLADGQLGAGSGRPSKLAAVEVSLRKCLSSLRALGPDREVVGILQRLRRGVSDATFTSRATLADLERAAARDTGLTPRDLEICVDAYDVYAGVELAANPTALVRDISNCVPPNQICQGTDPFDQICCSGDAVCSQTCSGGEGGGECVPVCVPKWCFPGEATVQVEGGATKAMRDVRLGDRLLVALPDGRLGYEEVYLNTHKDAVASAPYTVLTLASGRAITLSPRHFIPKAGAGGEAWAARVVAAADEIAPGDLVWSRTPEGGMVLDRVVAVGTRMAVGAYNPLTMNGTILVDGVVASAHSDWFLDGVVSADAQAGVYQAILAPVRLAYRALGPELMTRVTEDWGVVDLVRGATTPGGPGAAWAWLATLGLLALLVGLGARRRWRAAGR